MPPDSIGVTVTLKEIYEKVNATDDKLDELATAVNEMVAVNKRLDMHHTRLDSHGERIRKVEAQVAAQWIVVGVVVTVIGAVLVRFITGG